MTTLNLEIDGQKMELQIPNGWDEVSVGNFEKLWSIDRANLTAIEQSMEAINIFTGLDQDVLFEMSPSSFNELSSIIDFVSTDVKGEQIDSITVDGTEYFLKSDFNTLTMGEVISLEILVEKSVGELPSIMSELLCIFLREKIDGKLEKFKKSFMARSESFKTIPITQVNDLFLFFSNGEASSISPTLESSESQEN